MRRLVPTLLAFLLIAAPAAAQDGLDAKIVRTAHGVPHITADSWAGLGYGYGYAFAADNICVMADQYVTVRGERSRYFGPDGTWSLRGNGSVNRNLESDFFFKRIIKRRTVEQLMAQKPPLGPRPEVLEGVSGYVAGYNRYLREVGVDGITDPACRGKEWVKPIEEIDAYRRFYQLALLASGAVAINGIGGAQPPAPGDVGGLPVPLPTGETVERLRAGGITEPLGGIGSNAFGIGRDKTDNGKGILLGNPHFPWDGSERFYQSHLTIPGKLDVQGGSLFGVPIVLIGNTRGLGWSHTVSTAFRFTPFELTLVPGSPTTYVVDGVPKEMQRTELTVETPTGPVTRTLYDTDYGPMFTELLGQPLFPWGQGKAFAMGDANAANFRYLNHFFETNLAQSVREYDQVQRRNQGVPWVNSIAADSTGEAYYADISVVPHVTDAKAGECNTVLGRATFQALRLPVLDGARSSCGWGRDEDAVQPGTFGPAKNLPSMFRTDYTMNANDSYWLGNLKQPLEGFSRIIGDERTARSLRTRIGLLMVDGVKHTQQSVMDTVFNNRQYAGELWRDETVAMCEQTPGAERACPVLRAWNVRDDLDSRGALLFRRYAQRLLAQQGGAPFDTPFDPNDPANTPRGLRTEDPRGPPGAARRDPRARRAGDPARRAARRGAERGPRQRAAADPRRPRHRRRVQRAQRVRGRPQAEDRLRDRAARLELRAGRAVRRRRLPGRAAHDPHLLAVDRPDVAVAQRPDADVRAQAVERRALLRRRRAARRAVDDPPVGRLAGHGHPPVHHAPRAAHRAVRAHHDRGGHPSRPALRRRAHPPPRAAGPAARARAPRRPARCLVPARAGGHARAAAHGVAEAAAPRPVPRDGHRALGHPDGHGQPARRAAVTARARARRVGAAQRLTQLRGFA
jgi:acyl-homoserine-lactone acylase